MGRRWNETDESIDHLRARLKINEAVDELALVVGLHDLFDILRRRAATTARDDAIGWVLFAALLEDGSNYLADMSDMLLDLHMDPYRAAMPPEDGPGLERLPDTHPTR